jgi:hypothetical protein
LSPPDPAKKLAALIRKLRAGRAEPPSDTAMEGCPAASDRLLWQLVFSFLAWESSCVKASLAIRRLHTAVVDYNEMRVALADELAGMIGDRYPRVMERSARLRSALNDLYKREHAVCLERISGMAKRDARIYLESLEGTPPFVAARLLLLSLGGHAFPLDTRLQKALLEEGAVPPDLALTDASGWLERQFRAGEAAEAYLLLEEWMNDRPVPKPPKRSSRVARQGDPARERSDGAESEARKVAVVDKPKTSRKKPGKE